MRWSKLMYLAINGRGRLSHITVDSPSVTDPEYTKWLQKDSLVFSWIIENIHSDLVNQFFDYTTAKDLWKGIEALYSSGRDGLRIFDLTVKVTTIKQGENSIEVFYGKMISIWKEIDRMIPNPMTCDKDRTTYNVLVQQNCLDQFLTGINENLDKEKRDILNQDPLPSVEAAYAQSRREIIRRNIMSGTSTPSTTLIEIGLGLISKKKLENSNFRKEEKSHLKCSHCGGSKHTKEGFFKIIGYSKWWLENKKRFKDTNSKTTKKEDYKAKAHMMECKEDITNVEPGNKGGNISLNSFNVLGAFNSKLKKTKQEENKHIV